MSTEAIALSELIKGLRNLLEENPVSYSGVIKCLIKDVQKRTDPIQYLMDKAYAYPHSAFRPEFLRTLPRLQRQAICAGNLNFTVETEGFAGWIKYAVQQDFPTLKGLIDEILTPVAYSFRAILIGVENIVYKCYKGTFSKTLPLADITDLEILTNAYYGIKVQWLVEVANYFRIQIASEGQVRDNTSDSPTEGENTRGAEGTMQNDQLGKLMVGHTFDSQEMNGQIIAEAERRLGRKRKTGEAGDLEFFQVMTEVAAEAHEQAAKSLRKDTMNAVKNLNDRV